MEYSKYKCAILLEKEPETCWDCPCHNSEHGHCELLKKFTDYVPKECPIQRIEDISQKIKKDFVEKIKSKIGLTDTTETQDTAYNIHYDELGKILQEEK